ncbi:uncharacterized protein PHACADRAFT_248416 [Phanerochaete carnosa HHB-10118-sp]|uniref:N-acetyltransferase domain-containing protein n=1 Tax=Phanerochaete carnosa (strain HHB-10118-sp) TaxID=650164 RepID=K5WQB6_PHACS|nr:uncharacterized protein PHACADRAFT_248416 [Phanerochaete carnosa HHB-10118-sp]EKM61670.1 hypothetical protein PHACADRAFT_248416 [Phanerochaete carnosa HHB-10118-sp]
MPARTTPNAHSSSVIMQHDSASDFLAVAYPTLRRHEASSNIVLAHALKRVSTEAALSGAQFTSDADVDACLEAVDASSFAPHRTSGAFWLTLWSSSPGCQPTLDIVLACVDWTLGNYPIFLWSPKKPSENSSSWFQPRIEQLADYLRQCVGPERVFSIFGMTSLVKTFARYWSQVTGFRIEPEPFYAAYFSFCNVNTFRPSNVPLPTGHRLRRAMIADLEQVAQLCKEFADDSVHFPLPLDRARIEARELISKGQIWVYDANGALTTICAVTRNTHRVSAITKVYTTPRWRRRGCAEFLVRFVTAQLLFDCGKESVVLYVGHENSAQKVYHRVGFAGLCGDEKVDGVEDSLELGFVGSARGHW